MGKNSGFTIVENIAASVIIVIILLVLSQCIITATNWYVEGEQIKNKGQVTANVADGGSDGDVTVSSKDAGDIVLVPQNGSEQIVLSGNSTENMYQYNNSDTYIKNYDTVVPDTTIKDEVYEATRVSANFIKGIGTSILDVYKDKGWGAAGFSGPLSVLDNDAWVNAIKNKANTDGKWPALSDEFLERYKISESKNGTLLKLYIHVYTYPTGDFLVYAAPSESMNTDDMYAYLVYNLADKCWYTAPKQNGLFSYYKYRTMLLIYNLVGVRDNNIVNNSYGDEYVHVDSDFLVNFQPITSSQDVLQYVLKAENGWTKLVPNE